MRILKTALWVALIAVMSIGNASAQGSADEARELVAKAVEFGKAKGRDALLAEINNPQSQFRKGDLYVLAYAVSDGTLLGHPVNQKIVGKNMLDTPDPDGKLFRNDIWEMGKTRGEGWVDYRYLNPETKKIENKTTWLYRWEDLILCCGIYKQ